MPSRSGRPSGTRPLSVGAGATSARASGSSKALAWTLTAATVPSLLPAPPPAAAAAAPTAEAALAAAPAPGSLLPPPPEPAPLPQPKPPPGRPLTAVPGEAKASEAGGEEEPKPRRKHRKKLRVDEPKPPRVVLLPSGLGVLPTLLPRPTLPPPGEEPKQHTGARDIPVDSAAATAAAAAAAAGLSLTPGLNTSLAPPPRSASAVPAAARFSLVSPAVQVKKFPWCQPTRQFTQFQAQSPYWKPTRFQGPHTAGTHSCALYHGAR